MNRTKLNKYFKGEATKTQNRFFLIYEGTRKDPLYFEYFNSFFEPKKAIIIHVLEKDTNIVGSQPKKLIARAEAFLNNPPKDLTITPNEFDKFRFVLDVDKHPINQFLDLKKYCESLVDANLFISNINFEVWLYFHLDEPTNLKSTTSDKMKIELERKHIEKKINHYPKGYLTPERINLAIARAEKADLNKSNYFPTEKSSKVYLLMRELLEYSVLNKKIEI